MNIREIENEKEYSLYGLLKLNAFPWIRSYNSYLKLVLIEREALCVKIFGEGNGTTYRIKGENLIKFLNEKKYEKRKAKRRKANSEKPDKTSQGAGEEIGAKKGLKTDVGRGLKITRKIRK
ncbi:MAG: hypothetical protein UR99_C0017G0003 [Candidatus Moranbacteria bacterium GW2011_GWD2_36_12]|nr:MAG: hypothetical protein UR99_C0017G0003 [Candidatus Moranbacteria bacterium GW2011_GWD2_36_12]